MITFALKERESLRKDNMPEIGRFYGIVIKMFFKPKKHEPSHIHAIYNEYVGLFPEIKQLRKSQREDYMIMDGQFFSFDTISKIFSVT